MEIQEFYLDKLNNINYFDNGWNYFDIFGILASILNIICDMVLTTAIYYDYLLNLNSVFLIFGIFFKTLAFFKYLRINSKFSSLIIMI